MIDYKHKIFIKKIDRNYELKGIYINLSHSTSNSKNKLKPVFIALRFFLNNKNNKDNKLFTRYYKNVTKYTDNEIWLFAQAQWRNKFKIEDDLLIKYSDEIKMSKYSFLLKLKKNRLEMLNHNRPIYLATRPFNLSDRFFHVDKIRILRKDIKALNNKLNRFIEQMEITDDANC